MRKILIKRIEEIKINESGFPKSTSRWKNFTVRDKHISELDFNKFDDDALVFLFERIIVRLSKQM